jgi:hypothetical protein
MLSTDFTEKYTKHKVLLNEVVGRNEIRVGLFCWLLQRFPTYPKHMGVGLNTENIIQYKCGLIFYKNDQQKATV